MRIPPWLRVALVLLFVPVVVFSNPLTANAATTGVLKFAMSAGVASTANCQLPWVVNAGGFVVGASARCDAGPDFSPNSCQPYEGDCGSYGLVMKNYLGETCGSTSFDPFDVDGNDIKSVASGLGGGYVAVNHADCEVTEACLSYVLDGPAASDVDTVTCMGIVYDAPDAGPGNGACSAGVPHASWKIVNAGPWSGDPSGQFRNWELVLKVTRTGAPLSTVAWGATMLGGGGFTKELDVTTQSEHVILTQISPSNPGWVMTGLELYAAVPGGWNLAPPDPRAAFINQTRPTSEGANYAGWTQPAQCRFWFGQQVVTDPTTDEDTPFGDGAVPYVEPPDDTPTVVDGPEDETPDDEFSIWGAILAVLRAIASAISGLLTAITGLAGQIANLLKNALKDLFIPETPFSDRVETLQMRYDNRFPFNFSQQTLGGLGLGGSNVNGRWTPNARPASGVAAGGCPAWDIKVPQIGGLGDKTYSAVCDSEFTQAIRGARPFLLAGMVALAFWPVVRGIFFASFPLIKPVPSDPGSGR